MNSKLSHMKRWPFGLQWLQDMLVVFGAIDVPPPPEKSAQELATAEKALTQRELLLAKSQSEQADYTVKMLEARLKRLRADIEALNQDGA